MKSRVLAIFMRARMRPIDSSLSPRSLTEVNKMLAESDHRREQPGGGFPQNTLEDGVKDDSGRAFAVVRETMHSAILMNKTEVLDGVLDEFSEGYLRLSHEDRRKLLLVLAKEYDLDRRQVRELLNQYLGLELPTEGNDHVSGHETESTFSAFYPIERNLRHALKPAYEVLFERLNTHPGGLNFLSNLRAEILETLKEENIASLRALDSYLKEKLITWLSPAALQLHQITWDDPASLLEKIVAYEAVHPISNLVDLKRRLGFGRRCFGYFHSAMPGEPLIFIEVALLKDVACAIKEVLWNDPPFPESEATCALFYSISSTQPGLAGINLGKFLIKRVITLVQRDMPNISTFATLSPIPGFMQWLLPKLATQSNFSGEGDRSNLSTDRYENTFWENLLKQEEEDALMDLSKEFVPGNSGMEVMLNLLSSENHEWTKSDKLLSALKMPLVRLCARYLFQEKKRGKALDSVANFHLQNGAYVVITFTLKWSSAVMCKWEGHFSEAKFVIVNLFMDANILKIFLLKTLHVKQMIERINWMADESERGLCQSAGVMVNYVYRTENIEEYAHSYLSTGQIHASDNVSQLLEPLKKTE